MRKAAIPAAAVIVACCVACGAGQGRSDKLQRAITELNEGVRWGRLDAVLAHVHPDSQEHFLQLHAGFHDTIQISDYEIVSTRVDLDAGKADVGIKISWYRNDQMEAFTTVLVQRWEETERDWYLVAEEYRSGKPF